MRIISRGTLRDFWDKKEHRSSEQPLKAWLAEAKKAQWSTPQEIKNKFRNASFIGGNRVVFNIKGNDYRLVVQIQYAAKIAWIKFIGTHKEYDQVDVETVDLTRGDN